MPGRNERFPEVSQLRRGAIRKTIAHAVWLMQHPDFENECSWNRINYSVQDSQGTRGTITFDGDNVVGVFRDDDNPRNPWSSKKEYDIDRFLDGMPSNLLALAKREALKYVLDEYEGTVMPIITTAFWSEGKHLAAAEPWEDVLANGASLISDHFLDDDEAMEAFKENYEFSSEKMELIISLYQRKLENLDKEIKLSDEEIEVLKTGGTEGMKASRELFAGIGIVLPSTRKKASTTKKKVSTKKKTSTKKKES